MCPVKAIDLLRNNGGVYSIVGYMIDDCSYCLIMTYNSVINCLVVCDRVEKENEAQRRW